MSAAESFTADNSRKEIERPEYSAESSELPPCETKKQKFFSKGRRIVRETTETASKNNEQPHCPPSSAAMSVEKESDRNKDEETAGGGDCGVAGEKSCSPGREGDVRAVISRCVNEGKKVLGDASRIAADYHDFAREAAGSRLAQGRQQAETYAAKAKSSFETIVSSTRETANDTTRRLSETREALCGQSKQCLVAVNSFRNALSALAAEGKPRLGSVYFTGKKALRERNGRLAVSALAQAVACVLVIMTAVLRMALKNEKIKKLAENFTRVLERFKVVPVLQLAGRVPVVGHYLVSAAESFASEVKTNMRDFEDKES